MIVLRSLTAGLLAVALAIPGAARAQISTPAPSPWMPVVQVFGTGDGTLGTAVAMTSTLVVLGEPGANSAAGQVRLVRKQAVDDSWLAAEVFAPGDVAAGDRFGAAVAVAGDLIIVSAPDRGDGVVYVYQDGTGGPTLVTTLTGDADGDAGFGDHLAFDGDTLAVASPRVVLASKKGRVYVFLRDLAGTPWARATKLLGSASLSTSSFGASVAVGATFVAVGDPTDPNLGNISGGGDPGAPIPGGPNSGSVYVFDRYQGGIDQWGELSHLTPANSHAAQRFGASLSLSSTVLAVGAPGDDTGATGAGAVYLYFASPGGLSPATPILPVDPSAAGAFGRAVALTNGRLMVASDSGNIPSGAPAIYVFDRPLIDFEETSRLFVTSALPAGWADAFAFVDEEAVVGAPGLPEGATIYRRSTDPCDTYTCENEGTCVSDTGVAECDCRFVSYWGPHCENPVRCGSCIDTAAPPNDPRYAEQPQLAALGLDAVRSRATGQGVRVAVVGYGADFTHPDGPAHLRVDLGWDFVDDDADPTDLQGPGTAILGAIAAATDNAVGIASLAPDAEIIPIRVVDGVTLTTTPALVAAGIDHARSQAEIILVSVGGLADDPTLAAAVSAAIAADRVVIAPAGGYPGSYVRVTAVGALNAAGTGADLHGGAYAPPYDLLAPDTELLALTPGAGYATVSGQGLAPALVAAAAAAVWSASDFPSAAATRDAVEKTAGDLDISGFDQATGHGALRADVAVSFRLGCANCLAGTDPCSTNPCQHGGECLRVNDTLYECACQEGWTGSICQSSVGTPCATNPCQNGATCTDLGDFITCNCKAGYYGPVCADSDCLPNPCDNDGVCTGATQGSHFCLCQPGFNDTDCVNNIDDPCDPSPCVHGTCSGTVESGPSCGCDNGWEGPTCEVDVDECATDNGGCEGTCENVPGGSVCGCPDGYLAQGDGSCADLDECALANGGCAQHCTNSVGSYACSCDAGFTLDPDGHGCSDVVDCTADACEHGGTCVDGTEGYTCDCGDAYKGDACEISVPCGECGDTPVHPSDPLTASDWALSRIGAPWAWAITKGSPTVRVAIVSTGIDGGHPDAPDFLRKELSFDLVAHQTLKDVSGFGTYVAGLLAAPHDNGEGLAGVAPMVEVTVMKVAGPNGSATSFLLAEGITTAVVTGAQIILVPAIAQEDFPVVRDAVANAIAAGCLIIAPAGGYPGVYDGVLSVGGIDRDGQIAAAFSTPDLLAPDGDIVSTWPGADYQKVSAGAPTALVGGVAALVWSVLPNANADTVKEALFASAEDVGPVAWDTFTGYGVVRADSAVGAATGCGSCELAKDPCALDPCANGGTCARTGADSFTCACPLGYSGATCAQQGDPCVPNPCQNGASCDFAADTLTCDCAAGFGGKRCQYALGECTAPSLAPGCDDPAVEACVCDLAPQCCTVKWGSVCAQLAGSQCADTATPPSANDATRACVCAQIPECCSDTWKPICDELAHDRCEGSGDCSSAHRQPGCGDPDVQACVCDQEPLCCSYTWDTACAKIAVRVCGDPAAPGPGTPSNPGACDATHSGTGCADEAVESCVCAAFPHCCAIGWDTDCVKQAVNYCAPPPTHEPPPPTTDPAPPSTPPATDPPVYEGPKGTLGPCCEANADAAGCDEPVTEQCVCDLLGECCTAVWDERCAAVALQVCDAFCDPDAPPPSHPPVSTVPDPITFPDIPPGDPCFGATVALTAETCLTVAFQSEIETARRNFEDFGIVTPCLEEKAGRCSELMTTELDARFADALDTAPVSRVLVIKPFTAPADFLPSRVLAASDPEEPPITSPTTDPPGAPLFDLFPVFSASADVNSCAEYAFQVFWDYQRWRQYPNSLYSNAYSRGVNEGGIGRRGLRVEAHPPTLRRTVRTLTEALQGVDYIMPDWDPPELGQEFAARKNGFFGLGATLTCPTASATCLGDGLDPNPPGSANLADSLARLGTAYADLVLLASTPSAEYPARAATPWQWHQTMGDTLLHPPNSWTVTDLSLLDALEREFTGLLRDWRSTRSRLTAGSTPTAERPALAARLEALTRAIGDRLVYAADIGCMDLGGPGPCDWAIGDFLEEVETFYDSLYTREYKRCLRLTGNHFDALTWLVPNNNGTQLAVIDQDPRLADVTFIQFLSDLERSVRTVAGNVADGLVLAAGDIDEIELGNSYFGVFFGWDNRYRMKKPALNTTSGVCDFDANVSGDFHVVGKILGDSYDIYRAEVSADVGERIGYGRVVLEGDVLWQGNTPTGGGSQNLALNLVLEPTRAETAVTRDFVNYDEWITAFWVPVHLFAGITGQLGADVSVRVRKSGFNLALNGDTVCHPTFRMGIDGELAPFAGVYAKASAGIGIPGFEVGIGGRLTLIEGRLPFTFDLNVDQRPNGVQTGLENLVVETDARSTAELTAFKGDLYVYLEYPCDWGFDTCTAKRRLAEAKGWTRSTTLFAPGHGRYAIGQVGQICAAVAEIPNDVLDCEGTE